MTIKLMNGKLFLAATCLLLFAVMGQSQQDFITQEELIRDRLKTAIRSVWEGQNANRTISYMVMNDPDVRSAWGISDAQYQQIQIAVRDSRRTVYQENSGELRDLGTLQDNAVDEETRTKRLAAQIRMSTLTLNARDEAIDSLLTPEQKRKVNETQLATMSETPIVSPRVFEALHLTDAQKQQMAEIQKTLEPEFEKHLEKIVECQMIMTKKLSAEISRQEGFEAIGGRRAEVQTITQRLMTQDPAYKKAYDEMNSLKQAFSTQFRTELFDVLTDEQWARLQELVDNPPDYALIFRKKLRERMGEQARTATGTWQPGTGTGTWIPGPGAWQPGSSAIPEQYRQERNERRRFPRGEN